MKRFFVYSIMLMLAVTSFAQKVKPVQYGGMCQYKSTVNAGNRVYVVTCNGYGKKDAQAQEDAEVRVIRMVLYVGMPGKCDQLLPAETAALDDFIDSKQYKNYIMSVKQLAPLAKDKGAKMNRGTFDITVNVGGLDDYLHNNGIKSFGF